jgi:uncharacterized protein YkwD
MHRLRGWIALALLYLLGSTQSGGCGGDGSDSSGGGTPPGSPSNAKSMVAPPGPGASGPSLVYTANNHPVDWITDDAAVLAFEDQVLVLVNAHRAGLMPPAPALTMNLRMRECARGHSRHMRGDSHDFFAHDNPETDSPFDRMTACGVTYSSAAENIAAGYPTAADVVTGWLNSPGHRANIENPAYTRTGIGYQVGDVTSTYGTYWTQVFAN